MSYKPENLYLIKDIRDHLGEFSFQTGGDFLIDPDASPSTAVENKAYFTLSIVPDRPMVISNDIDDGTLCVQGCPLPHKVTVKFVYNVVMYTDEIVSIQSATPSAFASGTGAGVFSETYDTVYKWMATQAQNGMDHLNARVAEEYGRIRAHFQNPEVQLNIAFRAYNAVVQALMDPVAVGAHVLAAPLAVQAIRAHGEL